MEMVDPVDPVDPLDPVEPEEAAVVVPVEADAVPTNS